MGCENEKREDEWVICSYQERRRQRKAARPPRSSSTVRATRPCHPLLATHVTPCGVKRSSSKHFTRPGELNLIKQCQINLQSRHRSGRRACGQRDRQWGARWPRPRDPRSRPARPPPAPDWRSCCAALNITHVSIGREHRLQ